MGATQWYVHLSREEGADNAHIKKTLQQLRKDCDAAGVNLVLGFGPTFLPEITSNLPDSFTPYQTFVSSDGSGKEAKGTQEELLIWVNSDKKDACWKAQYDARIALEGHMKVARETPTFIYGESLDMTGFADGAGNPEPERDVEVAIDANGGSFAIAQRWVHDLKYFHGLPLDKQEATFGRTKAANERMAVQPAESHLSHVELREGKTGDDSTAKRAEMSRRSTPYAFHDGTVGLYFMGFSATQAPLIERMEAMYDTKGEFGIRDAVTDYSNPASGSFYYMPSVEALDSM